MKLKLKMSLKILAARKKELISVIIQLLDYGNSNTLVIGKMKDELRVVAIEEFVVLKPKMYSFLVDNN